MDATIREALAAAFDPSEVKHKPQVIKNNRALVLPYIDSRLVMDRLDEVLGIDGWQDRYSVQPDGSVVCRLRIRIGERWVEKTDVGSPSEQPDGGDRLKAAFSDALKRAAVKFGIGRYLYRMSGRWMDYDPVKKQIVDSPPPKEATPAGMPANGRSASGLPANGQELFRRLTDYDAKLGAKGALLAHVIAEGVKAGFPRNLATWNGSAIPFAVEAAKAFKGGNDRSARQTQDEVSA